MEFLHTYVAIGGGGGKLPPGASQVLCHVETQF